MMMSQVDKDEETKRRVSATMTTGWDAHDFPSSVVAPKNLIVPPSPSSTTTTPQSQKEAIVLEQDDDKKTSPLPPDKLIIPPTLPGSRDAMLPVKFPKARQQQQSMYTPPRSPLVNKNNFQRPAPSPKAGLRTSPGGSSSVSLSPATTSTRRRTSLPLLPTATTRRRSLSPSPQRHRNSLPPASPHRFGQPPHHQQLVQTTPGRGEGQKQKQRLSLTEALAARDAQGVTSTPSSSPTHHHHRLGDKKSQRVSLPPSAKLAESTSYFNQHQIAPSTPQERKRLSLTEALAGRDSQGVTSTPSSSPSNVHHRLGDKKTQRVSLPPSAKLGQISPSFQQQQHQGQRFSLSEALAAHPKTPSSSPSSGGAGHKLGDKKQRVSLPPSVNLEQVSPSLEQKQQHHQHRVLGDRKHRVSLPASLTTVESSHVVTSNPCHRQLGEKKSQRLSLPSATAAAAAAAAAATEDSTSSNRSLRSMGSDSNYDDLPRKGLRNNRLLMQHQPQHRSLPDISGPGAFFIPAALVSTDDDNNDITAPTVIMRTGSARLSQRDSGSSKSSNETTDLELGSTGTRDPTETTEIEQELEHGRRLSATRTYSNASLPEASAPASSPSRRASAAVPEEDNAGLKRRSCRFNAPWWCNVVVPLILAGSVTGIVIGIIKGVRVHTKAAPVPRPTTAPVVSIFETGTLPNFTRIAWQDPNSAQSKARDWLRADPNLGMYSQGRRAQRFALATIFHSLNGARWKNATNWLDYDVHECLWFSAHPSTNHDATSLFQVETNSTNDKTTITQQQQQQQKAIICNEKLEYENLLLGSDSLRGSLPAEVSLLSSLVRIDLEDNKIFGSLPSEIGSLAGLQEIALSKNELESTIPSELGMLSNLERLYLRENKLEGTLPEQLANLTLLHDLHTTENKLSSTIPTTLGLLTQLRQLRLGSNQFSGSVPSELGLCRKLELLNVGENQLTGLPTEIGELSSLLFLGIAKNSLNTTIPTELAKLTKLQTFLGTSSGIRGSIPTHVGSLTNLVALAIGSNRLTSTLPSEIGQLQRLQWLYFYSNQISGTLPSEIGSLQMLSHLHAFVNPLSSSVPSEVGQLTDLTELLLFETILSGELPTEIGNLSHLEWLNIGDTLIRGSFPDTTCALESSQQLKITADCNREEMICCQGR